MSTVLSPFRNGQVNDPLYTHQKARKNSFTLYQKPLKVAPKKKKSKFTLLSTPKKDTSKPSGAPPQAPTPDAPKKYTQNGNGTPKTPEQKKCEKLAVIAPLQATMKRGLKSKGIAPVTSTSKFATKCESLEALTTQFYNEIARKNQVDNFSGQKELPEIYPADFPMDYGEEVIDGIIAGVLTYISAVREKKEAGEGLSKVEETVNKGAEAVEKGLQNKAKEQAEIKIGSWFMDGGWMWILGSIVVLVVIATVVKR